MNDVIEKIAYVGCHPKNCGGTRKKEDIRFLVYHYTGNDGDRGMNNAIYYRDNVVQASAHYFVDDNSITQSVGDLTVAYAVGGNKYASCAKTGGGKLYGICTNANSISIEMCDTERNGVYDVTETTKQNALALGRLLMQRYNIPIERVVRHFDVTGKLCPHYLTDKKARAAFKAQLVEEETEDNMPRFNSIEEIEKAAGWAAPTIKKLIAMNALRGDGRGLDLSYDMLRILVINDRMGIYG